MVHPPPQQQSPPPPPPTTHHHQQFLSSILSQRGPSSVPYTEDVKWHIRQHLLSLSELYPSLTPKTATFTHNDGRSVNLLQSDGTLPMVYQNVTYNIPVVIWLMETYPRNPPLVFVNPTRDMVIKRQHSFVNPSGLVSIPYLQNWVYPSSNLVDLARNLSHYFGLDPPLFSNRRPNTNTNSNNVNTNNNSYNPNVNVNANLNPNASFGASVRPAIPPRSYPPSPYGSGGGRVNVQSVATEDPAEVYRRNAINKLVESVHGDVEELRKKREVEMEGMLSAQMVLRQREEEVGRGLREMREEKEALEQQLQMVLMNTDVLEGWVRENEGKLGGEVSMKGDEAFETVDVLSKQMLECMASDLAVEDVIYALDKAVQDGSVPVDLYLRNVRLLSREQFFHRATSFKVRAAQMQAQVTNMASRAPPYAV